MEGTTTTTTTTKEVFLLSSFFYFSVLLILFFLRERERVRASLNCCFLWLGVLSLSKERKKNAWKKKKRESFFSERRRTFSLLFFLSLRSRCGLSLSFTLSSGTPPHPSKITQKRKALKKIPRGKKVSGKRREEDEKKIFFKLSNQENGSSLWSVSLATFFPVHRQPMHATFPVPEQAAQVGDDEENSGEFEKEEDPEEDPAARELDENVGSKAVSSGKTPAPAQAPQAT